ncbi:MAG: translation initiation factor IF-3, partial [Calditrichaeota bacterium]|nr:translation initiation factor IF-3 [Calditrichota bacterium]
TVTVKEIRLRPKTDTHDMETKMKQAKKFLEQKNKVKFSVIFKGRELAYKDMGRVLLEEVLKELEEDGVIEQPIKLEGRRMTLLLNSKH